MKKYRAKPVEIEALQLTNSPESLADIMAWAAAQETGAGLIKADIDGDTQCISIETLEGTMKGVVGDYIIRGTRGEFYPCKPDVFENKYEAVEAA